MDIAGITSNTIPGIKRSFVIYESEKNNSIMYQKTDIEIIKKVYNGIKSKILYFKDVQKINCILTVKQ